MLRNQIAAQAIIMQQSITNSNQSAFGDHYDYVIAGAGAAGLSLTMHLIESGQFQNKSILLVDKDSKKANDRTWCFWEKEPGIFQTIVYKEWNKLNFNSNDLIRRWTYIPTHINLSGALIFIIIVLKQFAGSKTFSLYKQRLTKLSAMKKKLVFGSMVKG